MSLPHGLGQWLWHQWQRRGLWARLMQPVAAALQMWARRHQAQPVPLPARVLVVGNVTVGGTGKTPVVANVAQRLHTWGWRVAVITRGHGAHHGHPRRVGPHDDARHAGDEPVWLAQQLQPLDVPVVAAHDRVAAARLALAEQPGCHWLISDDGLQHHALARDVELLVFDARGVGNGLTLPAGPLREPWPRRADLVLQHGSPQLPDPQPQACFAMQRRLAHTLRPLGAQAPMPLAHWRDQAVQAFAGIGAPQAFFAMLQQAGLKLVRPLALADHAALQQPPSGLHPTLPLVCTAKDAVKASHWPAPWRNRLWVADLEVDCPPAFWTALQRAVSSVSSTHGQTTA